MSDSIKYDGKTVSFRKITTGGTFVAARRKMGNIDICPICKKKFTVKSTTVVILIISNQVGIPNRFVHSECNEGKTFEYMFNIIANSWKCAQDYKHWFTLGGEQ